MKKTKFLTCLAALTLLLSSCEVTAKDLDSDTTDTESSDTTTSDTGTGGDTGESGDTGDTGTGQGGDTGTGGDGSGDGGDGGDTGEPTDTYTYSVEVTNADALKELTYDGNAASQTGVDLAINLVTTSSTGDVTTNTASESDVTLAPASEGVVTVSGLTVTPVAAGDTTLTVTWTERNASTTADVSVTDVTVSIPEPTEPTTWSEYLAQNAGNNIDGEADINALLGAAIDEILPYVVPECGYNFITVDTTTGCVSFTLDNATYAASTLAEWESALIAFGYTDLGDLTYQNEAGYKVTLTDWTFIDMIYIYVYPPVDTGDEGDETLETAQAILNAAAAQTSYYGGFGNLHIDGQIPESGLANYTTTISGDLTIDDNNNVFGKFQWLNSDDPGPKIRYYYEKYYYYDNMANNGSHSYQTNPSSIGTGSSKNTINGVLDDRFPNIGFSSTYTVAFTNASSIDLASATDLELTTEDNGNYKLTLIYNDIWYCYKATSGCELVGAGYSTNWTSSTNFEIVYGEQTTRAAIDEIMNNEFFSVEVWFPKAEEPEPATCWSDYITNEVDRAAISEIFGSVEALDEFLPFYGDTEPASVSYGNHYEKGARLIIQYNSNVLSAWVSLLTNDGWSETSHVSSWNEEYTFEKDGYTVELDLEYTTLYVYVYPKAEAGDEGEEGDEDLETAQAILDAADDCDTYGLDWDAFHGEYIDESTDETDTLYLTTDSDGLYGSGICLDDGDPSFEYYYKNGKEYVHNSNNDTYYDGDFYYGDSYDDIFDDFTSDALGDAFLLDLDDDDWTLTTLSDGYELIVETTGMVNFHTANVEYVYITDLDYSLLAVAYGYTASSVFEGWYAEQATTAQVEASLEGFDPANWGEVEEETEPSANEQVLAALEAFTDRGADYAWGEGFSYTSMSIDSYSYVLNEIAATSDDNGYLTSSTIDFSIGSYDSYGYYSDGSTTYEYDGENVTDYESLVYDYSTFYLTAYMTFAWQDYEYILEALEEFVYLDDLLVDDDFVVSDTAIYIYAYTSDYDSYFELNATYDENGLTYLSFSSSINGEALAIILEPTDTVTTPEWYVPDDGGDAELTGWAAIVGEDTKAAADELLGADLDTILPAIEPDGGYTSVYVRSGTSDFYLDYETGSDTEDIDAANAFLDDFVTAITGVGYEKTYDDSYYSLKYSNGSYQIEITYMTNMYIGSVQISVTVLS